MVNGYEKAFCFKCFPLKEFQNKVQKCTLILLVFVIFPKSLEGDKMKLGLCCVHLQNSKGLSRKTICFAKVFYGVTP